MCSAQREACQSVAALHKKPQGKEENPTASFCIERPPKPAQSSSLGGIKVMQQLQERRILR